LLLSLSASVATSSSSGYYSLFHSGASSDNLIPSHNPEEYAAWAPARPHLKYCYIEGSITINDDGTYTHNQYTDMSPDYLQSVFDAGFVPIMQLWITNFDTVTENGLRNYLKNLSYSLGNRQVIWLPCYEFNLNADDTDWGDRGNGQSWREDPSTYNKVMDWIRTILDTESLNNILLGVHMNLIPHASSWDFVTLYLEGMRKADIVGSSCYDLNPTSWARAKQIYDMIGTNKPWIFFEYGMLPWNSPIPTDSVNLAYDLLETHPFVKGIIWYFPTTSIVKSPNGSDTITAITDRAELHDQGGTYQLPDPTPDPTQTPTPKTPSAPTAPAVPAPTNTTTPAPAPPVLPSPSPPDSPTLAPETNDTSENTPLQALHVVIAITAATIAAITAKTLRRQKK
jgi:hypothetical protein